MKQIASGSSTIIVLERGEELHESLLAFSHESGLKSAWLSGLGGAMSVTLGFYDSETKEYQWKEFSKPLEIISLTGNFSLVDDEPFWHIHGVFSGPDFQAMSGHVNSLTIGLTGELHITPLSIPLSRRFDDATGLNLIS
jgi:predicted DNA-binding protein with PD1-like motif